MVVEVDQPAYLAIVEEFGDGILHPNDSTINREKLGQIIFNSEEKKSAERHRPPRSEADDAPAQRRSRRCRQTNDLHGHPASV